MRKLAIRCVLFFLVTNGVSNAQDNYIQRLPRQGTFDDNRLFTNPGIKDEMEGVTLGLNHVSFLGLRKVFRSEQMTASYHSSDRSGYNFLIVSEKIGPYISRNTFYAGYVNAISLNKNLRLSAGVNLGGNQLGVLSNSSGFGGVDRTWNGRLGVVLKHTDWELGMAVKELFSRGLVVAEEENVIAGSYSFHARRNMLVNESYTLKLGGLLDFIQGGGIESRGFIALEMFEQLDVGLQIDDLSEFIGVISIKSLKLHEEGVLDLNFAYAALSLGRQFYNSSRYSLGLSYNWNK